MDRTEQSAENLLVIVRNAAVQATPPFAVLRPEVGPCADHGAHNLVLGRGPHAIKGMEEQVQT